VLVSFVLRVSAEALLAGDVVGHLEAVETGELFPVASVAGLVGALQLGARDPTLRAVPQPDGHIDGV
jgi:hypothetical protein